MASRKVRRRKQPGLFEFFKVDPNYGVQEPAIDEIVTTLINPRNQDRIPGVAVAVRVNMQVVHLNCYGYSDLETGTKITPDTIFDRDRCPSSLPPWQFSVLFLTSSWT